MNKILSLALLSALGVLQACSSAEEIKAPAGEVIPVKVQVLERQSLSAEVPVSGRFTTDDEVLLSFKTGGVIKNIAVNEGDYVRAGQVLATLEMTEIDALVEQASLAQEKASRDFERVSRLYKDSVATREQWENAQTGLKVANEQLRAAKFNDRYSVIRASEDGYVLMKMAAEGQLVGPGVPVLQLNGAGKGKWMLKAGVSDRDWRLIHVGDKAVVSTDADPDRSLTATVTRKSESVDPYSGTFTVFLTVDAGAEGLASGLFGKGMVKASGKMDVFAVPYESLMDGDKQQGYVFVTEDDKTARKMAVKIAGFREGEVLINAGLQEGMKLIVSGSAYLDDSVRIQINR